MEIFSTSEELGQIMRRIHDAESGGINTTQLDPTVWFTVQEDNQSTNARLIFESSMLYGERTILKWFSEDGMGQTRTTLATHP